MRNNDCDKLRSQLDADMKVSDSREDRIFELEKCLIYLKNMVADKEDYIMNLKKLIIEMKEKSQVYVSVNEDTVDSKLADFINASNDPQRLTRLFLREGEGVYSFGTKRVFVKMENGKIYIRVGGGFLSIEEFLRANVNIELEKMATRHPVNVLANNIAVSKVIAGRNTSSGEKDMRIIPLTYKNALSTTGFNL